MIGQAGQEAVTITAGNRRMAAMTRLRSKFWKMTIVGVSDMMAATSIMSWKHRRCTVAAMQRCMKKAKMHYNSSAVLN